MFLVEFFFCYWHLYSRRIHWLSVSGNQNAKVFVVRWPFPTSIFLSNSPDNSRVGQHFSGTCWFFSPGMGKKKLEIGTFEQCQPETWNIVSVKQVKWSSTTLLFLLRIHLDQPFWHFTFLSFPQDILMYGQFKWLSLWIHLLHFESKASHHCSP